MLTDATYIQRAIYVLRESYRILSEVNKMRYLFVAIEELSVALFAWAIYL